METQKLNYITDESDKQHVEPVPTVVSVENNYDAEIEGISNELNDKSLRISALETQVSLLQEAIDLFVKEFRNVQNNKFSVGEFTFSVQSLPKQDAMIAGVNSVGRPGLVLQANDGDRTYTLAKVAWDHNKQTFVLYAGVGATN